MLGVLQPMRAQHGGDRLGLADEQDILAIFLRSERRTPDGYVGCIVAAHRVNDDLHSQSSPFRLSMRSSARSEIFAFFSRLPLILQPSGSMMPKLMFIGWNFVTVWSEI